MPLVDPFIPASPRNQPSARRPQPLSSRRPVRRPVDGISSRPQLKPASVHPRTQPTSQPAAPPPKKVQPRPHQATAIPRPQPAPKKPTRKKKTLAFVGQILFVCAAMALGLLVQSVLIGQVAVLIYGICAVMFRIPSRTTFLLALMSLGVVFISSVRSQTVLASTFAVYAFLLLGVGTLTLARELRNEI